MLKLLSQYTKIMDSLNIKSNRIKILLKRIKILFKIQSIGKVICVFKKLHKLLPDHSPGVNQQDRPAPGCEHGHGSCPVCGLCR